MRLLKKKIPVSSSILIGLLVFITSCASIYDHYTFTQTIETKLQSTSLVDLSTQPYEEYLVEIESLKNQIDKMVIYEKAKKKNEITLQMWQYLDRPESSIHQFLDLWKEKNTLSPDFSVEFNKNINEMFDLLIDYETKKDQTSENAILQLIGNRQ